MNDKVFIDTNIWVYFWLKDNSDKNKFIVDFIDDLRINENSITCSVQIFNELSNVFLKKYNIQSESVKFYLDFTRNLVEVAPLQYEDVVKAIDFREKYKLSYYDSLMVQTAINSNCTVLYSEDLNHNQIFEKKLKVVNPFI